MDHVVTILISINCCQLWIVPCNTIQPITYYDFWRHSYVVDMITFSNSVYIYHPPCQKKKFMEFSVLMIVFYFRVSEETSNNI